MFYHFLFVNNQFGAFLCEYSTFHTNLECHEVGIIGGSTQLLNRNELAKRGGVGKVSFGSRRHWNNLNLGKVIAIVSGIACRTRLDYPGNDAETGRRGSAADPRATGEVSRQSLNLANVSVD